jgi:hypothetical protein
MKATISIDHRVSDGAEAAQFMKKLAKALENPVRMLGSHENVFRKPLMLVELQTKFRSLQASEFLYP